MCNSKYIKVHNIQGPVEITLKCILAYHNASVHSAVHLARFQRQQK